MTLLKAYSKTRSIYVSGVVRFSNEESSSGGTFLRSQYIGAQSDSGYHNLEWRDDIKQGINATTPRVAVEYSFKSGRAGMMLNHAKNGSGNGDYIYKAEGNLYTAKRVLPLLWVLPEYPISSNLVNTALTKFSRKARKLTTSFQTGVFVGELGETTRMLKSGTNGFRDIAKRFISDTRKYTKTITSASQKLAAANDLYLGFMFGVLPFINDIEDAGKLLIEKAARPRARSISTTAKYQQSYVSPVLSISMDDTNNSPKANVDFMYVDKVEQKVSVGGAVWVEGDPLSLDSLGITLKDFVPTLYELIPYSFVVDYFSNVGDVLLNFSKPIDKTWGYVTKKITTTRTMSCGKASIWGTTYISSSANSDSAVLVRRSVERYSSNLDFGLAFKVPDASSLKWLNMQALLNARYWSGRYNGLKSSDTIF